VGSDDEQLIAEVEMAGKPKLGIYRSAFGIRGWFGGVIPARRAIPGS
jgi:hypothetical protein